MSQLRQTIRALARRPAFTGAAILTLALALGAVTAIVSVIDMVLLRPLPYPRYDGLYSLSVNLLGPNGQPAPYVLSFVEFVRVRAEAKSFERVEAMTSYEMALQAGGAPETLRVGAASAGFLALFGLDPVVGRSYTESEDAEQARVVILDGGFAERRFGRGSGVIGRRVLLNSAPYTVIGITPAGYRPLLYATDAWVPLGAKIDPTRSGTRILAAAARLRRDVTPSQATEELSRLHVDIGRQFPETHAKAKFQLLDLHESLYGSYRPALLLLLGGVSFLLLMACGNVANLALGRVSERHGEIALRRSIGASRARILREHIIESGALTVAGAALGAVLAYWLLPALLATYPDALPADVSGTVTVRTFAIVAAIVAAAAVIAGVIPALHASSASAGDVLRQTSLRQTGSVRDRRLRDAMLVAQLAFGVLLLSAAGIVAASFDRLSRTHPGFDRGNVLTMQLAPPVRYPTPQARAQYVEHLLVGISQLPGVVSAGTTQTTWDAATSMSTFLEVEGRPAKPDENVIANVRHVTPGYYSTLRVAIANGRATDTRDTFGQAPVAVVSQSFAERIWPNQNAIGRRIRRRGPDAPWLTVVGVAQDVMDGGLVTPIGPTVYLPYLQQNTPTARITLLVRTQGDPLQAAPAIQRRIREIDPQQPIDAVRTVDAAMAESIAQPRFRAFVLGVFALAGLVLACVGVYGVAAYASALRRREIGVRLALGAEPSRVVRQLVGQTLMPVASGIAIGVFAAVLALPLLHAVLLSVERLNVASVGAASALLLLCACVASWLPASRTARIAPAETLRLE